MISLTRLNHQSFALNSDLIESVESTPDTLIKLTSGETMLVREKVGQVLEKIVAFRQSIHPAGRDRCLVPCTRCGGYRALSPCLCPDIDSTHANAPQT